MRTPTEIVELYMFNIWNDGNLELIREICADPMIRHDIGTVSALSHDDQIKRISHQVGRKPYFWNEILFADDKYVCSVWSMNLRTGETKTLSSIEVFQIEDGRITHVWNAAYGPGLWGREGDPMVPRDLPPPHVLASLGQIDRDWVQKVLKNGGVDSLRVGDVGKVEAIGHGTLSETARVNFVYNGDPGELPTSFICKFHGASAAVTDANKRLGIYKREVESYRFLSRESGLPIPKVYFAATAADDSLSNIVLEDLSRHAKPGDQIKGCSVEEADAVVEALGRLHARFVGVNMPSWALDRAGRAEGLAASYRTGASLAREWLGAAISEAEYETIDRFGDVYVEWARLQPDIISIQHGDPRVDNILFEGKSEGMKAWLVDWQLTSFGAPQYDLAYFLTGSLPTDERRKHEKRWIAQHAASLARVVPAYDVTAAENAFRLQSVAALAFSVVSSRTVERTAHNAALVETQLHRNCAAVMDWDGLDAIRAASTALKN